MENNNLHPLTALIVSLYQSEKIDINDIHIMLHQLYGLDEDMILENKVGKPLQDMLPTLINEDDYSIFDEPIDELVIEVKSLTENQTLIDLLKKHGGVIEWGLMSDIKRLHAKIENLYVDEDAKRSASEEAIKSYDKQRLEAKFELKQTVELVQKYTARKNNLVDGIEEKTGVDIALEELMHKSEDQQTNT